MNREQNVHAEPAEIDPVVIARAEAVTGPLVILPIRHVNGQAVYTESSMLVVKQLRATGLDAAFLDPPESRTFEVKESALADAVVSFALGIGSSAAWDAAKAVFRRRSSGSTGKLSITYVDLENKDGQRGTAWKVEGDSEAVLKAIDKLRQNALEPSISDTAMAAESRDITDSFPAAGTDDDLREAHRRGQVENLRAAAQSRLQDARDSVEREGAAQSWQHAEKSARAALHLFARSLDWAEDSEDEDEAHRLIDEAGSWVRQTFGCQLARSGTEYRQTCPVALAHNRIGMSIGGTAKRICSVCGEDLSECEHLPGTSYMVPGGASPLEWCRVCLEESCDHSAQQRYRVSVIAIIRDLEIREVSLVTKPGSPGARIMEMSVLVSELKEALGDEFVPGDEVSCDRCLLDCEGLTKHNPSDL